MSGVQTITVPADDGDQRLDRWLKRRFPQVTQGMVEKFCRKGELRLDGKRCKASDRIAPGQAVRIPPLPEAEAPKPVAALAIRTADADMIRDCVLWKDEHIIALNKPPGLPSQGGSGQGNRHVDGLTGALTFGYKDRPKLVHRLDKDTSGVLVLALNKRAHGRIGSQFEHRKTTKSYIARVSGIIAEDTGLVDLPLATDWLNKPRQKVDHDHGRSAQTEWQVLEREANATRVRLIPLTGRTHQLRVHMKAIGHVILGDAFYAEGADFEAADRLQLHAAELGFTHPTTEQFMTFTAPTPF